MRAWSYLCRSCNSWGGRSWFKANKELVIQRQRDRLKAQRGTEAELARVDLRSAYYLKNKEKWKVYTDRARVKIRNDPHKLALMLLTYTKRRCHVTGVHFSLTPEDIEPALRKGHCSVTDIEFDLSINRGRLPFGPSIDRIDPSLGYTPGNIQMVVWIYNMAKSTWGNEPVMILAAALVSKTRLMCNALSMEGAVLP